MLSFCRDDDRLAEWFECVQLLHYLCGILATGTDVPMQHIGTIRELMPRLHAKVVALGMRLKPKLHHMHHILDAMEWLGKCLSCFVTERKHRQVKDASLHVFRHMEHTVLTDVVNRMGEQIVSGHDLFERMLLVEPRECALQPDFLTSTRAVLQCGRVGKGDIIFFNDMSCGEVQAFFIISDVYFVEVQLMPAINNDVSLRDRTSTVGCFRECRLVVDSCIWHMTETAGVIRVCVPPVLLF